MIESPRTLAVKQACPWRFQAQRTLVRALDLAPTSGWTPTVLRTSSLLKNDRGYWSNDMGPTR